MNLDMGKFLPTEHSLAIAESIAKLLKSDFSKAETAQLSKELHEKYFNEISRIIGVDCDKLTFNSLSSRDLSAFAGKDYVQFDQQIDFWLFDFCHFLTILACKMIDDEEFETITNLVCANLNTISNPYLHEKNRELIKPLLFNHSDGLELSHAMSRAMVVFILCHEIAHIALGHYRMEPSHQLEWDADVLACEYFLKIINSKQNAGMIFIHEKLLFSPVLLMRFFEIVERFRLKERNKAPSRESHPSPRSRSQNIRKLLQEYNNEGAEYVLKGFEVALSDFITFKELPEVHE